MVSIRSSKGAADDSTPRAFLNIIGRNMLQNELLLSFLKKETGIDGKCFFSLESMTPADENEPVVPQMLLLDCKSINRENLWANIRAMNRSCYCRWFFILFNVESGWEIEESAITNGIQGILYNNETIHSILKGIDAVLKGELWYSRKTFKKIFMEKRSSTRFLLDPAASLLTDREKQVLSRISSGYTSKEIAADLEISLHTVKTHIYNIYKKIDVNDRLQASLWVSKYL